MTQPSPNWKFDQDQKVGAITTQQVLDQGKPILEVIHYGDGRGRPKTPEVSVATHSNVNTLLSVVAHQNGPTGNIKIP